MEEVEGQKCIQYDADSSLETATKKTPKLIVKRVNNRLTEKIKPVHHSTKSSKRTGADIGNKITRKKKKSISSDEVSPEVSSSISPLFDPCILMDESGINSENPSQHSSASDNLPNSSEFEELVLDNPPLINDFISFKNLELSDNLLQDQPNSVHDSGGNSGRENSFKPNSVFRNLLYTSNNDEAEESSLQGSIFHSEIFSEEEHILRDIRTVLENEDKLRGFASQTETFYVHHTEYKDVFQNPSHKDNQDCYDWDKFLQRWEAQFHDESEVHPQEIMITDIKRWKSKRISHKSPSSSNQERISRTLITKLKSKCCSFRQKTEMRQN